jgi:hypothetical protein
MPKCSINCTAPNLPLNTNHICPVCKRPVHGICVGKHLEDQPLGRDLICLDCAEADSVAGSEDEDEGATATATDGDEGATVTATVLDVSYKLTNIGIRQPDDCCSFKKKRGYKCVHVRSSPDEVVICSNKDCSGRSHLVCYLNFLGKIMFSLSFLFFLLFEF